jgi:hypothetical protein
MKNILSETSGKIRDFVSTVRGKVITIAGTAVLVVAVGSFAVVSMLGAADGSLPASLSGSTSSVSSTTTSSDDGTFAAASAITTSSSSVIGSSSTASSDTSVAVTSITLNKKDITLYVGDSTQIAYAINPSNATDLSVSWDSNDKSIATINTKCTITAVASGTATIKVTASSGKYDTCTVTVKAKSGTSASSKSTASTSGSAEKSTSSAAAPKASASATNAAGITDYATYGFKNGVSVTNTQVLTENWNFDQMVTDVTAGMELGDTVNYKSIPSDYRSKMCYYWGADTGGQKLVDNWISEVKQYHIIENCEFSTSKNDIYEDSNGNMLVRGKQTLHITSADAAYYKEGGISGAGTYYRIVDVIVATGAQSSLGDMSEYSIQGEYKYTSWSKE